LYRLDPRQFQIALDNAKANLAQTALTIVSMKQDYGRMLSDVAAQQARVAFDQATYDRNASLVGTGAVSRAAYDQARYTLETGKGNLESLRQQAAVQLAKLGGNLDILVTRRPQFLRAEARVDEAQRQLDDSVVKAPFAGIVTQVSAIARGKYLAASTTAFFLVGTDHVWVDATPKETELKYVRTGQPVTVRIDTYPDAVWRNETVRAKQGHGFAHRRLPD
jgi:membrane fusion protein (multidrug efflux system)